MEGCQAVHYVLTAISLSVRRAWQTGHLEWCRCLSGVFCGAGGEHAALGSGVVRGGGCHVRHAFCVCFAAPMAFYRL